MSSKTLKELDITFINYTYMKADDKEVLEGSTFVYDNNAIFKTICQQAEHSMLMRGGVELQSVSYIR